MSEPKIESVVIENLGGGMFDPIPKVVATFDDKQTKALFSYYPDEISFNETELVGLTEAEALEVRQQKDVRYIQS